MPADIVIYLLGIVIGIFLGLLGGSGSILTVPILVYVANISPMLSTTYSLFIVGMTSLVGLVSYYRRGAVSIAMALPFAIPSVIGVLVARLFLYPLLPDTLLTFNQFILSKSTAIMLLFTGFMFLAAISMIVSTKNEENTPPSKLYKYRVWVLGCGVGILTSFIGAGGGFLIIPALVLLLKVPMKLAVGTSLSIIACNSFFGFSVDLWNHTPIEWNFLLVFSLMSIIGIFLGIYMSSSFSGVRLRKVFGYVLVCMSFAILMKEVLF